MRARVGLDSAQPGCRLATLPEQRRVGVLTVRTRQPTALQLRRRGRRGSTRFAQSLAVAAALIVVGIAFSLGTTNGWARKSNVPVIVSGTLKDGARTPLAAATVDLYAATRLSQRTPAKPYRVGSAATDRNGRFVVRAPGRLVLNKSGIRNGGWLKLDLLTGNSSLTFHRIVRRRFVGGHWVGPTKTGRTDLGVLVLAPGQPSVTATTGQWGATAGSEGWIYGYVVRQSGSDPRSGGSGGATVPVSGDTIVARDGAGSASAVSARDGSFQMRVPAGLMTVTEDICGVSKQVMIESSGAARVTLEIPNSC